MADEQPKQTSGGSKRRRRRRKPRKRKRSGQPKSDGPKAQSGQSGGDADSSVSSRRRRRRRRRSRSKGSQSQRQEQAVVRDTLGAKLPESIFVYTHVLRSSELDTFGFRSDPFMNQSRSLSDFRIDLSPIFPESGEDASDEEVSERRIFDAALHGPIVTTLAESLEGEAEDEAEDEAEGDGDGSEDGDEERHGEEAR